MALNARGRVIIALSIYAQLCVCAGESIITQKTPGKRPPRSAFDRLTKQRRWFAKGGKGAGSSGEGGR